MKLPNLSVFFPAYNEEANIARTVENALKIIPGITDTFEIIVVNDGSTDNTAEALNTLKKKYSVLKIVTHEKNKGYGGAIRSGFEHASFDYVFFSDGDGQFDLGEITRLTALINECDIAAGIRTKRRDPFYRSLNAKAYNLLVRILFGLKVRDIDCAFKLIKKPVLESVMLKSDSQFISAEFLIRASKKGFIIRQCPVTHLPRYKGVQTGASPKAVIGAFRELFILWKELR